MQAFVEHEIPQGLGKKSVVVLPMDNGTMSISVPYTLDIISFLDPCLGADAEGDGLEEIEIPDDLAHELCSHYEGASKFSKDETRRLRELVKEHRHA